MFTESTTSSRSKFFPAIGLATIILLGTFLRFYHLGASSVGNEYYAAAVKSMLLSWHNFFFVAFEPGGSIALDKPPLGFWLEAASAYIFGLNGFALAFPNALAGILSIPLLYAMVNKQFGSLAGLTSALALAITPVTVSTERNNTIDGMLVFVLLLSAWAMWQSVESGKFHYLLLGAFIVGLGFNIKMLQAYMVLPALYALYFFGAKYSWGKRIIHLGIATVLLLVVSLTWALIVDAVPASERPFVGASTDNTVTELIVGHNGVKRLMSASTPQNGRPVNGGAQSNMARELGEAGVFRLFKEPLASQASWLLPFSLMGLVLTVFTLGIPNPLTDQHRALILWAGWLLPLLLYFTFTSGLWHTYYLIMLGPALAALVGITVWSWERNPNWLLITLLSGITLGFQIFVLSAYRSYFIAATVVMVVAWLAGIIALKLHPRTWALTLVLLSLMIAPLLWSGLTAFNSHPNVDLPVAGPAADRQPDGATLSSTQQKVLAYLLDNTESDSYLAATVDSHGASPFIIATGRPVFTFGGYVGNDNVIDAAGLQTMVASGKLRYIMDNSNLSKKPEISRWVQTNCRVVQVPGISQAELPTQQNINSPRDQQFSALYECGN